MPLRTLAMAHGLPAATFRPDAARIRLRPFYFSFSFFLVRVNLTRPILVRSNGSDADPQRDPREPFSANHGAPSGEPLFISFRFLFYKSVLIQNFGIYFPEIHTSDFDELYTVGISRTCR